MTDEPRGSPTLALLRLRLLPSAVCDVVAGIALTAGFAAVDVWSCLRTLGTAALLYTAGMVLNDVADAAFDRRLGRNRPIAAGRISRRRAAALGVSLLAAGLAVAPWSRLGLVPAGIAALVLCYDFAAKRVVVLGAIVLGCCRFLNVAQGALLASSSHEILPAVITVMAAYGVYVALTVVHGALEDRQPHGRSSSLLLVGAATVPLAACVFLSRPLLGMVAALPVLGLALRMPASGPSWVAHRTGFLLRGLPRVLFAVAVGSAAWIEAAVIGLAAYALPVVIGRRTWT